MNPLELLPLLINHLQPQVDILVLMSHLGINADRAIAAEFPQLDVIFRLSYASLIRDRRNRQWRTIGSSGEIWLLYW